MMDVVFNVSEFVALVNQTLEYAYGSVVIVGELANFRVSKNKWVYFDLKDEQSSVRFFGTVFVLPGPVEEGMTVEVRGNPRLHPQFGFSVTVQSIRPVGEGSIKKAASLLQAKLTAEGLFEQFRKRILPYPPQRIGLITSRESAAYADFTKIIDERWRGLQIDFVDVQVQGEAAAGQIITAIEHFNQQAEPPEVLVLIRGGGSTDDLGAFSTEQVTRAVAASRVPMLVAIGHEIDVSLAELAADRQASTPSNAAELLVPDRQDMLRQLGQQRSQLTKDVVIQLANAHTDLKNSATLAMTLVDAALERSQEYVSRQKQLVALFSPRAALERGYALIRQHGTVVRSTQSLRLDAMIQVELIDGNLTAKIKAIERE